MSIEAVGGTRHQPRLSLNPLTLWLCRLSCACEGRRQLGESRACSPGEARDGVACDREVHSQESCGISSLSGSRRRSTRLRAAEPASRPSLESEIERLKRCTSMAQKFPAPGRRKKLWKSTRNLRDRGQKLCQALLVKKGPFRI